MPIQPNFLERLAFYKLNAAPTPMLDLAGALSFQVLSTAVHLNIFNTLQERPFTLPELTQSLDCQERGLQKLLSALVALGYVTEKKRPLSKQHHDRKVVSQWNNVGFIFSHHLLGCIFARVMASCPQSCAQRRTAV